MATRLIGAVLGAVIAPVVLILMVLAIYRPARQENWDWVTPMLTIGCALLAIVGGAIAGALIAEALKAGDRRLAMFYVGVSLALCAALPLWLLSAWYLPGPNDRPTTVAERAEWAQLLKESYRIPGSMEMKGRSLADELGPGGGNYSSVLWREFKGNEDAIAANITAYRNFDDGWRWTELTESPRRYRVFMDPRFATGGPEFVVQGHDVFRRANADAPAFAIDTVLAAILALPGCIERFAGAARNDGTWDGRPDTLPVLMAARWAAPLNCPQLSARRRPEDPPRLWRYAAEGGALKGEGFELTPADTSGNMTPFYFRFMYRSRGFLREPNGAWHVGPGPGGAGNQDPAPPRCLFDLSIPCDE